jgi:hypothetical protein
MTHSVIVSAVRNAGREIRLGVPDPLGGRSSFLVSIEIAGSPAAHQERRRHPCDHRGSSAIEATVSELRIEALATVP